MASTFGGRRWKATVKTRDHDGRETWLFGGVLVSIHLFIYLSSIEPEKEPSTLQMASGVYGKWPRLNLVWLTGKHALPAMFPPKKGLYIKPKGKCRNVTNLQGGTAFFAASIEQIMNEVKRGKAQSSVELSTMSKLIHLHAPICSNKE